MSESTSRTRTADPASTTSRAAADGAQRPSWRSPPDSPPTPSRGYLRASLARVRAGESGVLPVVGGLLLISILFQSLNCNFLTAGNLVNLLVQAAVFSLLAMAEVFVLLLGEIDLSVGFVAGIGGVIMAELDQPAARLAVVGGDRRRAAGLRGHRPAPGHDHHPHRPALVRGDAGRPAVLAGRHAARSSATGGSAADQQPRHQRHRQRQPHPRRRLDRDARAGRHLRRDARGGATRSGAKRAWSRRRRELTLLKIAGALAAGVALVLLCNTNRGMLVPIRGVPWVVLLVLGVLVVWTFLLGRTKFGPLHLRDRRQRRGRPPRRRRRDGIRTLAFVLCSFTAGIAGIVYASRLQSISTAVDGGTLVLYAVAAAVIGGTSLFGGRGKAVHGVLGGIVIAAIDNGMGLVGFTASAQYMVTALVLLAAVVIDALSRRGRVAT